MTELDEYREEYGKKLRENVYDWDKIKSFIKPCHYCGGETIVTKSMLIYVWEHEQARGNILDKIIAYIYVVIFKGKKKKAVERRWNLMCDKVGKDCPNNIHGKHLTEASRPDKTILDDLPTPTEIISFIFDYISL